MSALPHPIDPGTRATWNVPANGISPGEEAGLNFGSVHTVGAGELAVADFHKRELRIGGCAERRRNRQPHRTVRKANVFRFVGFPCRLNFQRPQILATQGLPTSRLLAAAFNIHAHLWFKGRNCFEAGMGYSPSSS